MEYSKELRDKIWEKGISVEGYDSKIVRKDACGAWIIHDLYGDKETMFGWEIDHIFPESKLKELGKSDKASEFINLRPLNVANNVSKSDSYPEYKATLTSDGEKNIECDKFYVVNKQLQDELTKFFNL